MGLTILGCHRFIFSEVLQMREVPAGAAPQKRRRRRNCSGSDCAPRCAWGCARSFQNGLRGRPPAGRASRGRKKQEAAVGIIRLGIGARCFVENRRIWRISFSQTARPDSHRPGRRPDANNPARRARRVGNIEAQRLDQMQHRACGGAGARDVAGVLRDLRLDQNDVQHSSSRGCSGCAALPHSAA